MGQNATTDNLVMPLDEDTIIRLYGENRNGDWRKTISLLAHLNGVTDKALAMWLNARAIKLRGLPVPVPKGAGYMLVLPKETPDFYQAMVDKLDGILDCIAEGKTNLDSLERRVQQMRKEVQEWTIKLQDSACGWD